MRDAWHLSRPYFHSEEKWSARVLLVSIIFLNLALVGMDVVLNFWNGAFYDSLQQKNWHAFVQLLFFYRRTQNGILPGFCWIAAVYILVAVYSTYLNQWLQIRWRRWLTGRFLDEWLADRAYYRISLTGDPKGTGTDNPDQRISDDLRDFVNSTLSLGLGLLSNVVSLLSFVGILWALSGPIALIGFSIPGYMVWVALVYAIIGTWLTDMVGRPLSALSFQQQRVEADFRFNLARLRENTEGVALYGGEAEERTGLNTRFHAIVGNWWAIMQRTKALNALTSGYAQVAVVFPIVVAAPRYFAGAIQLGGLTRTASAFGQVQGALSWFVSVYANLATWAATVERLGTFDRAIKDARAAAGEGPQRHVTAVPDLALRDVKIALPDGRVLLDHADITFKAGESVAVMGRSGVGKSTLFRAIAGIWPFGTGEISVPPGRSLFLPQRPYIPLGTLRHALCYPLAPESVPNEEINATLVACGLGRLSSALDEEEPWAQRLSGGEQQRLAFARALLVKPDWLFMDEATTNLDPDAEAELYALLKQKLPQTTVLSITHRPSVAALHRRRYAIQASETGGVLAALDQPVAVEGS